MNIAICDDKNVELDTLEGAVRNCRFWKGEVLTIDRFLYGRALLQAKKTGRAYSYVFLDINLPDISGLDVYNKIATKDTGIVFVSTHLDKLPDVQALRLPMFLAKPYSQNTFDRTVQNVLLQAVETKYFNYIASGKQKTIPCSEIVFMCIKDRCLFIQLAKGNEYVYQVSLNFADVQLSEYGFYRCSKTHIVNLRYCDSRIGNEIVFKCVELDEKIELSRRKLKGYDDMLFKYIHESRRYPEAF